MPYIELSKFNILRFSEYEKWAKFVYDARKGTLKHDYDAGILQRMENTFENTKIKQRERGGGFPHRK